MPPALPADLYLASRSPRRRELLRQIGVRHQVVTVDVPEEPGAGELAADYVKRLALSKALAGVAEVHQQALPPRPVLGADTLVVCDGRILEKPRDEADFRRMLGHLSGRSHEVYTALALCSEQQQEVRLCATRVDFRELGEEELLAYWLTGEPRDKAGGYAIQGLGALFVNEICGSYSNVVGLPLETLRPMLQAFGVPWWQTDS